MQHRRLGTSELEVSVLALGTWALAGDPDGWGSVDDNESIATIEKAVDLGIDLIDTAPGYGRGHCETIVGKALRDRRDRVLIATKCGLVPGRAPGSLPTRRLTRENIFRECEASLRRLQTEHIDLYQCDRPDPDTPLSETFGALQKLLEEGKVRTIGLSNFSCEEITGALQLGPVHAIQTPFSLLQRRAAEDLLPYCQARGIAALVYSPLGKGLLTGKFTADSKMRGLRAGDTDFFGPRFQRNLELVEHLTAVAARYRKTIAQLALQWAIQHPGITAVIVGAKRPSQIEENVGGEGWALLPEDLAAIENLLAGA